MEFKYRAYKTAMDFESIYDYSDQYKVEGNPSVWKFMNLDKFESMLRNNAQFFAKPSAFIDPLEGSYSKYDIENAEDLPKIKGMSSRDYMKKIQEFSGISCWHMNEFESAAMWDLYLNGKNGIAIQTTYNKLISSADDLKYRIFSGELQYINFNEEMTSKNIFDTLFYKRKSFSHENELRLMIVASRFDEWQVEEYLDEQDVPVELWQEEMDKLEKESYEFTHEKGTLVSWNIKNLVEKIYVSPLSSKEFVEEVKKKAQEYGFPVEKIVQSDLYEDFIY